MPKAWGHRAQAGPRGPHQAVELKGHFARSARPGPAPRQSWGRAGGGGSCRGGRHCHQAVPSSSRWAPPTGRQLGPPAERGAFGGWAPGPGVSPSWAVRRVNGGRGERPGSALPSLAASAYQPSASLCTGSQEPGDRKCPRGWGQTDGQPCPIQQASRAELVPSTCPEAVGAPALAGDSSSLPTTLLPLQPVAQVPTRMSPRRACGNFLSTDQQKAEPKHTRGSKLSTAVPQPPVAVGTMDRTLSGAAGVRCPAPAPWRSPFPHSVPPHCPGAI